MTKTTLLTRIKVAATVLAAATMSAFSSHADTAADTVTVRPVASVFMADIGHASQLDTYLSPIRYSGWHTRLSYERLQAMKFNNRWISQLNFGADYSHVTNPVKNHTMHSAMADASWHMLHNWRGPFHTPKLQLMAGAGLSLRGGAIYAPSNSNNVVSIKLRGSIDATAMAVFNTRIARMPVTLRYQATIPVIGAFFSPEYDESYYEIYVGNHKNLAHLGWWANRFDMTNLIAADLHLGDTVLRIGWRNRIESSWINHLNTQIFTNSFIIGVGGDFSSLGSRKHSGKPLKVISSIY